MTIHTHMVWVSLWYFTPWNDCILRAISSLSRGKHYAIGRINSFERGRMKEGGKCLGLGTFTGVRKALLGNATLNHTMVCTNYPKRSGRLPNSKFVNCERRFSAWAPLELDEGDGWGEPLKKKIMNIMRKLLPSSSTSTHKPLCYKWNDIIPEFSISWWLTEDISIWWWKRRWRRMIRWRTYIMIMINEWYDKITNGKTREGLVKEGRGARVIGEKPVVVENGRSVVDGERRSDIFILITLYSRCQR